MGIFQKLSTLIRSNINDLIARAENPEKMLNQIIDDMRGQLASAKREVAAAIADERKLRAQVQEEADQAKVWEERAMLAVRNERDDLAKEALGRHQEHAERASTLERTWRAQAQETEKLKASLRRLNDKIEEAKRKRNLLIAKQKRAQAQRRIHETMSGLSDTSAFEAFDRMAEKIEDSERKSLAAAEIDESLTGDTLDQQFQLLESGADSGDVADRLLALKRRMGLLPPAEEERRKQLEAGEGDIQEAQVEEVDEDARAPAEARAGADSEVADGDDEASVRSEKAEAELIEEFERLGGKEGGA